MIAPRTRENQSMLRSSSFAKGFRLVVLVLAVAVVSVFSRASNAEQSAALEASAPHGAAVAKAEAGHEKHAGQGEKTNPMKGEPTLAIWTLVVFLGLMTLLGKFAWKPLVQALHNREEHLEHCLLQSEKARNDAERLLADHRRLMAETDDKVRSILHQAQRDAQTSAADILRQAQAEADASRDRAQRDIATARDQALADIWGQTAEVAVSVAGRVLGKNLGDDDRRRLLDQAIAELPSAPNGQGGARA
jgi:F-type H+-transporting ATPase subunit b